MYLLPLFSLNLQLYENKKNAPHIHMVGQFLWFEILNFNFLEERFEDFVDIFWQGVGEGSLVLISFLSFFFFFFWGGGVFSQLYFRVFL